MYIRIKYLTYSMMYDTLVYEGGAMPSKTIFLRTENLAKAEASGEGVGPFINRLIEQEESHEDYNPSGLSAEEKKLLKDGCDIKVAVGTMIPNEFLEDATVKMIVNNEFEPPVAQEKVYIPKISNPNACKECGWMKTANRCINKNCKLKGKLQG